MSKEQLSWREIENFGPFVVNVLDGFLERSDLAARAIQEFWRARKGIHKPDDEKIVGKKKGLKLLKPGPSLGYLMIKFYQEVHWASVKYDGTNVGKGFDNAIYGRRIQIEGTSYQKTSLQNVINADIASVQTDLFQLLKLELDPSKKDISDWWKDFVVYGELMVHKTRFDYNEKGYYTKWLNFGVVLRPSSLEYSSVIFERLCEAGFATRKPNEENPKLTILFNRKLKTFLESHSLVCADIVFEGTLKDLVLDRLLQKRHK